MAKSRNRSVDLLGLVLLIVVLFLILSLHSYQISDPISEPIFPLNRLYQPNPATFPLADHVSNWCGHTGALVADLLFGWFGWGAYYLTISLVGVAVALLSQRPLVAPFLQLTGWSLSLVGITALASILAPGHWNGPVIGPGGYLGALGSGILSTHFWRRRQYSISRR